MEELRQIEQIVNQKILMNDVTQTSLMTPDQAIKQGAMALFGEKYGEEVRVVSMGHDSFSVELCGGTHVQQLGDIGLFKITSESSVSAGIRRIEAITGTAILELLTSIQNSLTQEREQSRKQVVELQKQLAEARRQYILQGNSSVKNEDNITDLGGVKAIIKHLHDVSIHDLKALVDRYKQELKSGVVVITSTVEGKIALIIGTTNDLTDRLNAVSLVQIGLKILGGKGGGGRLDLAQGGGPNAMNHSQLDEALSRLKKGLAEEISRCLSRS
jgi:alanyl-tRNA synthetase